MQSPPEEKSVAKAATGARQELDGQTANSETKTNNQAKASKQALPVTPAQSAVLPVKPVAAGRKGKTSGKPTPAEIASGARGGATKQAAMAPRFDFADEVESTKPKGSDKGSTPTPAGSTGKPAARKLDTVVSVTKTQASHSEGEKGAGEEKTKPKK
jgi:hypothetical protein